MNCTCATLSSVACLTLQYFPTLPHNSRIFLDCGGGVIEQKCVFWSLLQLLSETFLILRRTKRDMIKNVHWSSLKKYLLCFSDFNETWIFSKDFQKIIQHQITWKIHPSDAELFHLDGQRKTDRWDEANSRFSQFRKCAKKTKSGFHCNSKKKKKKVNKGNMDQRVIVWL